MPFQRNFREDHNSYDKEDRDRSNSNDRRRRRNDSNENSRSKKEEEENNNFNRNTDDKKEEENNELINLKNEAKMEEENYLKNFKRKYNNIIEDMDILFKSELKEEEIIKIIMNIISNPSLTIFEVMNFIYREAQIIKTIKNNKSNNDKDFDEIETFEDQNPYINRDNLKNIIQNYKVYDEDQENIDLKKYWLYVDDSDKRRKLLKNKKNFYNYLPILNLNNESGLDSKIYAKNDNEILYHSLFYKTMLCKHCDISEENEENNDSKKKELEENELCPYAHNILKDFRIIYDYQDENVINFMKSLEKSNLFKFEAYTNYIPMNLSSKFKFNLDSFKVHKCQLDASCPNDYHVCPYYHKSIEGDEQRRPPSLFGYNDEMGNVCFDKRKKKYCLNKCESGIYCKYIHSKNEYNYHPKYFRKKINCTRKKLNGRCIYYETCYGIHPDEENNATPEKEKEEEEEINEEEIEEDEEVKTLSTKVTNSVSIGKIFRCMKCLNVSPNGELCYFVDCKHFLCIKCFKKMHKEKNKKAKEENQKLLSCPFCEKELKLKGVVLINFDQKDTE